MKWQKPLDEAATCLCVAYPRIEEACGWLGKAAKRADGTPEGALVAGYLAKLDTLWRQMWILTNELSSLSEAAKAEASHD